MIFLTSIPKAGTHLVASVIQELVGAYPTSVKKAGVMHASAYDKYRPHACLVGHFRDHQLKANDGLLELFTSRKVIVLIRDPRDVCKSMIHYLLSSDEPRQRRLADLIRGLPMREQMIQVASGISLSDRSFEVLKLEDHCDGFLGVQKLIPHACIVRYEDFFTDVGAKQLSGYLGYNRRLVKQAVSKALGGRSLTKRQGVPYEWMHSFDDELKAYFDTEHAEVLRKLGYPLSTELDPTMRKLAARAAAAKLSPKQPDEEPAPPVEDGLDALMDDSVDSQPDLPSAEPAADRVGARWHRDGESSAAAVALQGDESGQARLAVTDSQRLRHLEQENARLKRLLANSMLEIDALREMLGDDEPRSLR